MTEQELERQRAIAKEIQEWTDKVDYVLRNSLAHCTLEDNNYFVPLVLSDIMESFDHYGNLTVYAKDKLKDTEYTDEECKEIYNLLWRIVGVARENKWWTLDDIEPIVYDQRSFAELKADGWWQEEESPRFYLKLNEDWEEVKQNE